MAAGIVCLTLTLVPLRASHDEWWHLKSGRYIEENGLPRNDVFTYTAASYRWVNHEWLAQVTLWRVYRLGEVEGLGGVRAVIVFKAAWIAAAYLAFGGFLGRAAGVPAAGALAAAMTAALSRRTLFPRPPFLTYGLLALTYAALLAGRRRGTAPGWLLLLIPLFALWANLHGGFLAGLVVVGAFWLEAVADWALAAWRLEPTAPARRALGWMSAVLAGCVLATAATPYGFQLLEVGRMTTRVVSDPFLRGRIGELLPPDWRFVWALDAALLATVLTALRPTRRWGWVGALGTLAVAAVILRGGPWAMRQSGATDSFVQAWAVVSRQAIAAVGLGVTAARSKERLGLAPALIALFFAFQGIEHVRHLPLFGVAAAPLLVHGGADWVRAGVERWDWTWRGAGPLWIWEKGRLEMRRRRLKWLEQASLTWLLSFVGLYLFLPEEAASLWTGRRSGVPLGDRLRARSLLDRNWDLLRPAPPDPIHEPGTERYPAPAYPKAAVDFLIQAQPPGRLFNGGNYAGYLIWRLSPEKYQVFTDNRFDIYGGDFLRDEAIVLEAFPGDPAEGIPAWGDVLRRWQIRTLFIPADCPLQRVLEGQSQGSSARWRSIWNDGAFAIWTLPEGAAYSGPLPITTESNAS